MPKAQHILLSDGTTIPILHEDRSILAIDKPPGWMLVPTSWDRTGRNLQRVLELAVREREHWARSRNLRYLRFIHRLDADTSGLLLLAKSPGALQAFQKLFETRGVEKEYLAVTQGMPGKWQWICRLALRPDPQQMGRMRYEKHSHQARRSSPPERTPHTAKPAETHFHVLQAKNGLALVEARPITGRTHQIRVHLAASGYPVLGETLYKSDSRFDTGGAISKQIGLIPALKEWPMALRAVRLRYRDPFTGKAIEIAAPFTDFVQSFGFHAAPTPIDAGTNPIA